MCEKCKMDFEYWIFEFNLLQNIITIDTSTYGDDACFMNLFIFKEQKFAKDGIFDISIFQKQK